MRSLILQMAYPKDEPRSPHEAQRNAGKKPITAALLPAFHFVSCGLLADSMSKAKVKYLQQNDRLYNLQNRGKS